MTVVKWTDEEKRFILRYLLSANLPNNYIEELTKKLKEEFGTLYRRYGYNKVQHAAHSVKIDNNIIIKGSETKTTSNMTMSCYEKVLSEYIRKIHGQTIHYRIIKPTDLTLAIGDLHIPFWKRHLIGEILDDKENQKAGTLLIGGDFFDAYCVSKYPKNKSIPLIHEYRLAYEFLKMVSKRYDNVVLIDGNHEKRISRYFEDKVAPEVHFLIHKYVMELLASGAVFDQEGHIVAQEKFKNVHYQSGSESWWVKIGDCIYAHPNTFKKGILRTIDETASYFTRRNEDFHAVVNFHTHFQGKGTSSNGKLLIEPGCLCEPLDYQISGRVTTWPQQLGYARIYQDKEGRTDFNKSNYIYCGTEIPKKDIYNG